MSDRFAAFHFIDYRLFTLTRLFSFISHHMLILAISQYVYETTHDPLNLGFIGLAIFLPKVLFTLIGGQVADLYDRRAILLCCRVIQILASAAIWGLVLIGSPTLLAVYFLLSMLGLSAAFDGPASNALFPRLIPDTVLGNAVTWNAATMQIGVIAGPALAGALYATGGGATQVLMWTVILRLFGAICVWLIQARTRAVEHRAVNVESLLAGIQFVSRTPIVLGAISLDLFAVLLGGAVALLPVYANDILKVGPQGLGYLRAAPAIGAAMMALVLAYRPPFNNAGRNLFVGVGVFGAATIVFGLSTHMWLSLLSLMVLGAADMISVVIRGTLVQMYTPEEMRGRVSAVNMVFIGASNELGEFESGVTARVFGVVEAVLIGGVGTILIVAVWSRLFPALRDLRTIEGVSK